MGKLRDLLKAEGERYRSEKTTRQQALKEWLGLLDDLFARTSKWLEASDPEGLLEVTKETVTINDPALGEYEAPALRITLGKTTVEVAPRARYVIAAIQPPGKEPMRAQGLVEIRSRGWTNYNLYQLPGGDWYIFDRAQNLREGANPVEPLDAERFEAALASLLR